MNKILFIIALLSVFYSCKKAEHPPKYTYSITHKKINISNNYIGKGGPMMIMNNNIIGIDYGMDTCFYCINTTTNYLYRFGNRGQGPNEFINPITLQYLDSNTFGSYDIMSRKFNEIHFSTENMNFKIKKSNIVSTSLLSFYFLKSNNNQYIGLGPYKNSMFISVDSLGEINNYYYNYPYKDSNEENIKNHLRAMAYQGKLTINPSKSKFVYTSSLGEILHFYEISKDNIKYTKKIEKEYPIYTTQEEKDGFGAPLSSENMISYICSYATEEYVYFLYSGEKLDAFLKESVVLNANNMHIYDWNGNFIKNIKLDVKCSYFCISSDNKKMWAIIEDPDPTIVYFDLP